MRAVLAIFFCLTLLSGCGFQPVHGARTADLGIALKDVTVEVPTPDRLGQLFRIALEDSVHPDSIKTSPKYRLTAQVEEVKQPIIIERDASITRYNLILKASYELKDLQTGESLAKRRMQRISSYNVSDSDFATYMAERNARERGTKELAHTIVRQLAAFVQKGDS